MTRLAREAAPDFRVLDVAAASPFAAAFRDCAGYIAAAPVSDAPPGTVEMDGRRMAFDALDLPGASLDLILTSDVLDLLPDPDAAL